MQQAAGRDGRQGGRGRGAPTGAPAGVPLSVLRDMRRAEMPEEVRLCRAYGALQCRAIYDATGVVSREFLFTAPAAGTAADWVPQTEASLRAATKAVQVAAATATALQAGRKLPRLNKAANEAVSAQELELLGMSNQAWKAWLTSHGFAQGSRVRRNAAGTSWEIIPMPANGWPRD